MRKKDFRKSGLLILWMLIAFTSYAQYTVTGGNGTPLLVTDDTSSKNKIQVYLVNGLNGVEISYTSSSTSHQWYRYKTKALERETVASTQNGTTSTLRDVADGYGYYVENGSIAESSFIWIIDYSKYAFNIQSLSVSDNNACEVLQLLGTADMKRISYQLPVGSTIEVKRQFEVTYNTLVWSADTKMFSQKEMKEVVTGNPFTTYLEPPLCDTDIQLSGDLFARHFNIEKTMNTGLYEAVALQVESDTTVITDEANMLTGGEGGISAPAEIHFAAYANTPVAAVFKWKIYQKEEPNNPFILYDGEEMDYTFNQFGTYIAELQVSDRSGQCEAPIHSYEIKIVESGLDIPNAFSPGTSPGINDEFKVAYKSLIRFKGVIFNRWGLEMFQWTDPAKGWDGKKGGKYVVPGVYFYAIEAEGSDGVRYKKSGDINIIRPKTIDDEVIEKQ